MANPTWFVAKDYLANKLAQLNATDPKGNWTAESLTKALEGAGYKGDEGAFKHFNDFGMNENVSPNALFNVNEYLAAKANQMNALNIEGKTWSAASVYDAIVANGMNVWQHYDMFGSKEGVNPSNAFNAEGYIAAKTVLMNSTKEGGRADWSIAEVKAALAENGLSALEHYNLFGQAEFKAAGKDAALNDAIKVEKTVTIDNTFDPFTGVKTYDTLSAALTAQKDGSLAKHYAITTATDVVTVTVAQQAGLADLLAGATPAITTTPTYHLVDTVAALAAASTTVLTGSKTGYDIADSLANVAAGADGLVNSAAVATAKVAFGAKGESTPGKGDADVVTTTVKYDDIDGDKTAGHITLARADADATTKAEGKAEIVIDASATATALGVTATPFVLDTDALKAFTGADTIGATFNFMGTAKGDTLTVGTKFASINAGAGDDTVIVTHTSTGLFDGGTGTDTLQIAVTNAVTFKAGQIKGFETLDLSDNGVQAITMASADYAQFATIKTAGNDTITFSDAANKVALHAGSDAGLTYNLAAAANTVTVTGDKAVTIKAGAAGDTIDGSAATGALTITGGAGADKITLGAGADTVVLGAVSTDGIDSVTGFDNGKDILSFSASTAKVAAKSAGDFSNLTTYDTLDKVLATFATGATNVGELDANEAVSFTYDGDVYVVIGGATAGYTAAEDAVVKLTGITLPSAGIDLNGAAANA